MELRAGFIWFSRGTITATAAICCDTTATTTTTTVASSPAPADTRTLYHPKTGPQTIPKSDIVKHQNPANPYGRDDILGREP